MPWIRVVPAEEAVGDLQWVYEHFGIDEGPISAPFEAMTINGPVLKRLIEFTGQIRFGDAAISRLQKEMMATYVSKLNDCVFWTLAHRRWILREGGSEDLGDALARGETESPLINEADREMLRYARKLTLTPGEMVEDDVARLRETGFSDEAIGDIAITISMYAYMNRIVDGIGGTLPRGMDREAQRLGLGHVADEPVVVGEDDWSSDVPLTG